MSIPESIKSKRPTQFGAVEIRQIGGHYYTYLVSSRWDAAKGRSFLNHISLLYYYGLLNALRATNLDEKYSAEDILKLTKNIYRVNTGDSQADRVSAIQKRTQDVLDTLGVNLLRKN